MSQIRPKANTNQTRPACDFPTRPINLAKEKTLFVVAYTHLDTQYRWSYPQVIGEYLPNTLKTNFALLDRYPNYLINFSGSRRYQMIKQYFPADYAKLKKYIAAGRWFPCGSSVDEADTNIPSAESLIRQVLYGSRFFRQEFNLENTEFMLPDCFGFTAALPSILAHCGIRGFSTAKLNWGSAVGIPFKIGRWIGVDGQSVIAALDPGAYDKAVSEDLSRSKLWLDRIENTGAISGVYADYHYYGSTGDRGGAPPQEAVAWMERAVASDGPVRVIASDAERMFREISDRQAARLPQYKGELLLTEHSAGAITSQAYMKRWNRKNELLADAAERASVAASWLGGVPYPSEKLLEAWTLVLGSQMHDMLPGTSRPEAYEYSWNDEVLALNQFAAITESAVASVAAAMDTRSCGVPLVVFNPLSIEREDLVEAIVRFPESAPEHVSVFAPDGKEQAAQILSRDDKELRILFLAKVPPLGFAIFDFCASDHDFASDLKVSETGIENQRFRVDLDRDGNIASIFDKQHKRQALSAPIQLAFLREKPEKYPAWNMDWSDRQKPPRAFVKGPAKVKVIETGPMRVTIEVIREAQGSRFVEHISLSRGDAGNRVEVSTTIDWQTRESSLKAVFPLAVANPSATYDIALGAIERGNNDPKKYEVPQHQWFDITGVDGKYGIAVLNDSKYGSDKPDDRTLRLTLLYTPGVRERTQDQATQDIGRHEMQYAIVPHAGDWREAKVAASAARFNQPLLVFQCRAHDGKLGRIFSLAQLNTDQVMVTAMKKAEEGNRVVIRLREMTGKPAQNVKLSLPSHIRAAAEVDGRESVIRSAIVKRGSLITAVPAFGLRAFSVQLETLPAAVARARTRSLKLTQNFAATRGNFDGSGRRYASLPAKIVSDGIRFILRSNATGRDNALPCKAQRLKIPKGFDRIYFLAAAVDGDQSGRFTIGERSIEMTIQHWRGFIGQWDNRQWEGKPDDLAYNWDLKLRSITPGFIKRDPVAWFSPHLIAGGRIQYYQYAYLFKYHIDMFSGEDSLVLPRNSKIKIFATTLANDAIHSLRPARQLYDTLPVKM